MDAASFPAAGILTSRIGRRFVVSFAGGALLPLLAFAWIAAARVNDQLGAELEASLHNGAKTAGMGIAARLSHVAGDLALVREFRVRRGPGDDAALAAALGQHVGGRLAAAWLETDGVVSPLVGQPAGTFGELSAAEREHLAAGKPLVRVAGTPLRLAMALSVEPGRAGSALVAATVRDGWFWDAEELQAAGCRVGAFDRQWRPLFHTFADAPDTTQLARAAAASPAAATVTWRPDGEPHVARYWRAFLQPQYHFDLFVVQSRPRTDAFAVGRQFTWWFAATAASTLLLVALVSLVQMRRTLGPIVALHHATRRVAAGELGERVSIRGNDEFAELGVAFNHMTAALQENVRRRERTERELLASRDAALAAARAKAEFVTNVSHELRTPMTEFLGALEILGEAGLDGPAREEFTAITLRGARRLARLVDDVLELDSADACARGPVDLAATLAAAVAAMPAAARERVRLELAPGLPPVAGDADRLTETWARLLDNAAKFSPAGAPIGVRAHVDGAGTAVEFTDHGVGISRLDLDRVFEPFCQVGRDQLTEKAQGTGLGLTLARRVVEQHGGRIEVESELGNGATFRVWLPAAHATAGAAAQP